MEPEGSSPRVHMRDQFDRTRRLGGRRHEIRVDAEHRVQPNLRDHPCWGQGHVDQQRDGLVRASAHGHLGRRPHLRLRVSQPGAELLVHVHQSGKVCLPLQRSLEHAWNGDGHRLHAVFVSVSNTDAYAPEADRDGDGQAGGCARVANSHVLGEAVASRVEDTKALCNTQGSRHPFRVGRPCGRCCRLVVIEGKRSRVRVGCRRTRRRRRSWSAVASRAQNASVTHTSHTLRRVRKRVN